MKTTLVIGASQNPARYSYLAVKKLVEHHHPVIALGNKLGNIDDVNIETERKSFENVDTVTLYINPAIQEEYYNYIISLHPQRVIFNPGTENSQFAKLLKANGIEPIYACTLVMLSTNQY
jgi:predicted CoA-binding protein